MQIICMSKLSHFEFGTSLAKNQGEINPSALVVNGRLLRYHCTYLSLLPVFEERTVICSGIPRCKQANKQAAIAEWGKNKALHFFGSTQEVAQVLLLGYGISVEVRTH